MTSTPRIAVTAMSLGSLPVRPFNTRRDDMLGNRTLVLRIVAAIAWLSSCDYEERVCAQAAEHLAGCYRMPAAQISPESCDPSQAERVLAMSCEPLFRVE